METFFLSLTVLFAGGLFSLITFRQFSLMKAGFIVITTAGCLIGLYSILAPLQGAAAVKLSYPWLQTFTLSFTIDSLSAFFLIPIFVACPLTVIYCFHYMEKKEQAKRIGVSFFFASILMVSMALVATADNIVSFVLAWELMSLSSFFLVVHEHTKETTRRAGFIYFIFTQTGAMFLFIAFALAYTQTGSFDFTIFSGMDESIKVIVFFLALVGFGSKAGIFPLHIWLPHAHPAAPSNISAVMSGVMIKMGIYGIIRLYFLLDISNPVCGQVILVFGMISGVLGVVYALGKQDLKKLLAYSSVENIGIILIGTGIGMIGITSGNAVMAGFGLAGSLLHVLNHSIFKPLLFLGAGAVVQKTGTKDIDQLGGLIKRMPITGKTFLTGSVAIAGLPPFNGFISEFLIYYGAFHGLTINGSSFILTVLAILSLAIIGGLAASCFSKVVGITFLGEPRTEKAMQVGEAGFTMTFAMMLLSAGCLIIGVFPEPFVDLAFMGLRDVSTFIPGGSGEIGRVAGNLALASRIFLVLFLLTILFRKICYRKKDISASPTWGCGFTQPTVRMQYTGTSYAMSIMDFFRPFVGVKTSYSGINRIFPGKTTYETHIDDIAETTLIERIVTPIVYILGKLRWIQHGHIQLYIGYIIVTIIVLLLFV